jgi:hypothetical protein
VLTDSGNLQRDTLYWHYPHYHPGGATPYSAIRHGDMKLIEFFEDNHVELYDLKNDQQEKNDLAKAQPNVVKQLHDKLVAWRTDVGAQYPTPNPNYDPAKDGAKPAKAKREAAMLSIGE